MWLGLKTVIIVKMMVKIQKRTINSNKIHTPLAKGWSKWWWQWSGWKDLSSLGRSHQSRAKNLQYFKSIHLALANSWGHAYQTDSPTLLSWLSIKLHWVFGPITLAFCITGWTVILSSANSDKTPHHTHLQHAKISQKSQRCHSCSQPAVRPHLPSPTTQFQLKLKKPYQSIIYFGKQGSGQTSKTLQNWNK